MMEERAEAEKLDVDCLRSQLLALHRRPRRIARMQSKQRPIRPDVTG